MLPPTSIPTQAFTGSRALSLGWRERELRSQVVNGGLTRLLRNVYAPAAVTDTMAVRARASALVLAPDVVFCDRTAAWLHGVDVYDYRELEILPAIDCCLARDGHRVERPECRGVQRDLEPVDICLVDGLRVTTPLRTAMDLGTMLSRPDALSALDAFMREHGVTSQEMLETLRRYRGRRGVVKLRGLVPLATPLSESPGESRTRLAITDEQSPAPQPQHWVLHRGEPIYRLDLAWPKSRVAVEYDGEEWHDLTPAQREADRTRRRWLETHGWTVIVVRKGDFREPARDLWLTQLKVALRLVR